MPCCESCFIIRSKTKSFASLFSSLLSGLNMDQPEGLHSTAKMQKARMAGTSGDCMVQTPAVCSALSCAFRGPVRSCYFQSERSHRTNCSNPFFVLFFFSFFFFLPAPFLSLSRWTFKAVCTHCCFSVTSYLRGGSSYISATIMFQDLENSWIPLSHLFSRLLDPLKPSLLCKNPVPLTFHHLWSSPNLP